MERSNRINGMIVRENPCFEPRFDPFAGKCDVLDELGPLAARSTASIAMTGMPVSANRMLHRL